MKAILELEKFGYIFTLKDDRLHYTHPGPSPDRAIVEPLLLDVKQNRDKAIHFLRERIKILWLTNQPLATIVGQTRLIDEGIEATYHDHKELTLCLDLTQFARELAAEVDHE